MENPIELLLVKTQSKGLADLAKLFGVHYETVRLWRRSGEIPTRKVRPIVEQLKELGVEVKPSELNSLFG